LCKCEDYTTAGLEIGYALSQALKGGERSALADFLLDSQTLNKISIDAALRLPT
jgi:hypothetical protein